MTEIVINANDRRIQYTATGGQTVFPYDFPIYEEADITVLRNRAGTLSTLVLTTDYTLSGVGAEAGGNVTLTSGATLNDVMTIYGDTPYERTSDYGTGGDFKAATLNKDLDRLVMMSQQLDTRLNRTLTLNIADPATGMELAIETAANRLDRALVFNSAGTGLKAGPTIDEISSAQGYATAAGASATAAAASETAAAASETAAATSETNAAASEAAAATSETNAASSASAASTSATNAANSASAASTSATNAASSATAAENARDDILNDAGFIAVSADLTGANTIGQAATFVTTYPLLADFGALSIVQGDIVYGAGTGDVQRLAKDASATRYLSNTGANNNPAWAQINLTNGVTGDLPFANLAQGAALSVLGVTGNATADVASITAGTDHQVLRRSGTALAFGAVDLSQAAAVTGALPLTNGGTGATTASNARTNLGLGTIATQAASAVAITGGDIKGCRITSNQEFVLADDAAASFSPPTGCDSGLVVISQDTGGVTTTAVATFSVTAAAAMTSIVEGSLVDVNTTAGTLTGTTGVDGQITIRCNTDGLVYVENRRGGSRTLNLTFLG